MSVPVYAIVSRCMHDESDRTSVSASAGADGVPSAVRQVKVSRVEQEGPSGVRLQLTSPSPRSRSLAELLGMTSPW